MTEYLTEQEQIQQLKNWIKQYGMTIIAGIIIALLLAAGWRYWQNYQNRLLTHASLLYDQMLTSRAQNNTESATLQAAKLKSDYKSTPYAKMAAFLLAREATLKKNYPEAINQLNWVIDNSHQTAMREIARIRIARILIAEKNPDAALSTLKKLDDKSFIGLVDEVRGDALSAKEDASAARKAYQLALSEIPDAEVNRPILQMKYDNLAVAKN